MRKNKFIQKALKILGVGIVIIPSAMPSISFGLTTSPQISATSQVQSSKSLDGYEYSVSGSEATITGYTGPTDNLTIPSTLDGYAVTSIATYAFSELGLTGTVTIPESVSSIGNLAFSQNNISTVIINSLVLNTAGNAFRMNSITNVEISPNTSFPTPTNLSGIFSRQTVNSEADLGNGLILPVSDFVTFSGISINSYLSNSLKVTVEGTDLVFDGKSSAYSFTLTARNDIPNFYDADFSAKADYSNIEVKDSTIPLNSTWRAQDNFISATTTSGLEVLWGETVDGEAIITTGTVNTAVSGVYPITYSIGSASRTINVTVDAPTVGGDVTAKYVDTDGNKISDDVVKSGNVGDAYTTEQKTIAGYTFKEIQGSATGTFTDQAQTVIYVYTKNKVTPKPDTPQSGDNNGNTVDYNSESKNTLPQTGDDTITSYVGVLLGAMLLMIAALVSLVQFKKTK